MTNLTEQYINNTLPVGSYYIKLSSGEIISSYYEVTFFSRPWCSSIKEILAPVPTFEEWQRLNNTKELCAETMIKLLSDNHVMETQLKIAREALQWFIREDMDGDVQLDLIENGGDVARQALAQMGELKGGVE